MAISRQCILLFLRAPERDRVKTRLAAALGDDKALALYRLFVEDTLATLSKTGYPVILWGHPKAGLDAISSWLGPKRPIRPQTGDDLGQKMANAFSKTFSEGFEEVVLIGSDLPDLPPRTIRAAFLALNQEGAALGPSADGGYYLIAFRKSAFLPEAFEHISWSTENVLAQTLSKFKSADTPVRLLEKWQDIDTIQDLRALSARHPGDISAAPGTLAFLRRAAFKDSRGRGAKGDDYKPSQNKSNPP